MSNHRVEGFTDIELSVPGHTALISHNHNTGARALSCEECETNLGRFLPERWREKHIREAWNAHLTASEPTKEGRTR